MGLPRKSHSLINSYHMVFNHCTTIALNAYATLAMNAYSVRDNTRIKQTLELFSLEN